MVVGVEDGVGERPGFFLAVVHAIAWGWGLSMGPGRLVQVWIQENGEDLWLGEQCKMMVLGTVLLSETSAVVGVRLFQWSQVWCGSP